MDRSALASYLNDHAAGAIVALDVARRYRDQATEPDVRATMERLVREIVRDRAALLRAIHVVGSGPSMPRSMWAVGVSWVAWARSRFADPVVRELEDLETLCLGVFGKRLLWGTLANLPDPPRPLPVEELDRLSASADRQEKDLIRLREDRLSALTEDPGMRRVVTM
jgi:hypothetical protein